ncbi:MAG TPA: helix-turn-helix domain-containing protein [Pirellulales bacterium]|jgi:excisionase family DNA binding protein|nr:helix-turn-helix domain-containing protein [Pirellulales bacterium]
MPKSKPLDTVPRFAAWLHAQFDAVQVGKAGKAAVREASLAALRLGAGDIIVADLGDDPTQTATLAAFGKLLAWCRSQPDGQLLWDAGEAAERLGISPRTLWSLTKSSTIPSVKVGHLVRYCPTMLREWISANGCLTP